MSTLPASPLIVPEPVDEPPAVRNRGARTMHTSIGLAALAILLGAALLRVQDGRQVIVPLADRALPELCYWRTMFGIDCPGCGLTRCFISAAHGHLVEAWRYNPVGLLLFAGVVLQLPYRPWQLWRLATGRNELKTVALPYAMLGASGLLLAQWLLRLML